jgi:signal recognition particle receptor subunit beta
MARADRTNRRLDLKIVFWGPARSGKTTAMRSLHGACDPRARSEFASVEGDQGGERTSYFDYALLELPRYRGLALRVDCFSVPGAPSFEATRRRLLRDADGVVFVADLSPAGLDANAESWKALDRRLRAHEGDGRPVPVALMANKRDLAGPEGSPGLVARLLEAEGGRPIAAALDTVAERGAGLLPAFQAVVAAAADRALARDGEGAPEDAEADRRGFVDAMAAQFGGRTDGASRERLAPRRTIQAIEERGPAPKSEPVEPDTGEIDAAVHASRWLAVRDVDVRELQRERALGRLLLDVGQLCAAATDVDGVVRSVLIQLVMNLEAVGGWIGVPEGPGGEAVFDSMGRAQDGAVVAEAARVLGAGLPEGSVARVGAEATMGFPGGVAGGEGAFFQFPMGAAEPAWILLVGPPHRGLPEDSETILAPAAAFLGLAVARLGALTQLRDLNRMLEERVEERTLELRREKERLEERVKDRTREVEHAKKAALETERVLLDRERKDGVQQLAAGVAHDLNNPVGAIRASLDFLREQLEEVRPGGPVPGELLEEMRDAVKDCLEDAGRMAARVAALFGGESAPRRAALRTSLYQAVLEGIRHFRQATPDAAPPALADSPEPLAVGVTDAELTRWVFRLLSAVAAGLQTGARVSLLRLPGGPGVRLDVDVSVPTGALETLRSVREEVRRAGGRVDARIGPGSSSIEMTLPLGCGERATAPAGECV